MRVMDARVVTAAGIFSVLVVVIQCFNSASAIPLESFYPFGPCLDRFLPQRNDISRPIRLNVPINFYGYYSCKIRVVKVDNYHQKIYMHTCSQIYDNGYASLVKRNRAPVPMRLPGEVPFPFIAPFQSDVDIRYPKSRSSMSETDDPVVDFQEEEELEFTVAQQMDDWFDDECDCELPGGPPLNYCENPSDFDEVTPPHDCNCPVVDMFSSEGQSSSMKRGGGSKNTRICPPPGRVWYRESNDTSLLDRAQQEIQDAFDEYEDFSPISLVIATWDHVGSFKRDNRRTNTFQLVLISDGNNTFAMFLYADNEMQWSIPLEYLEPPSKGPPPGGPPPGGPPPGGPLPGGPPPGGPPPGGPPPGGPPPGGPPPGGPPPGGPPPGGPPPGGPPPGGPPHGGPLHGGPHGSNNRQLTDRQRQAFGPRATVGINAGDLHRFQRTPYHESAQIVNIDKTSNIGVPGQWIFKLDGEVQVGLTQTDFTVLEDREGGKPIYVRLCVEVSGPGMIGLRPLQLIVEDMEGTATKRDKKSEEGDYAIPRSKIRLFGESVVECTNVVIVPDDNYEGDEEFTISLVQKCPCFKGKKIPPFLAPTPVTIYPSFATIKIIDNDAITVGLEETVFEVLEDNENGNQRSVEVCVTIVNGTLRGSIGVNLTTISGSASEEDDFVSDSIILTLDNETNTVCGEFFTVHDVDMEGDEVFFVELSLETPDSRIMIDPDASLALITIVDNEFLVVLEAVQREILEDNGAVNFAEVCATLVSGQLTSALDVVLRPIQQGSAILGEDYGDVEHSLVLTNSNNRTCGNFPISPDTISEGTEDFFIGLDLPPTAVVTLDPSSVEISILDNDAITVGLTETVLEVDEGAGPSTAFTNPIEICASVTGGGTLQTSITLTVSVLSGVARNEIDFELTMDEVVLSNVEEENECGLVAIVPDPILEIDEGFQVMIAPSDDSGLVIVNPASLSIMILDNDVITIGLEETELEVEEDDGGDPATSTSIVVCATIISGAVETLSLILNITPISLSAIQGTDFSGSTQMVTLDENTDTQCATFATIPNSIPQPDRMFTVELSSATSDPNVVLLPSEATFTIVDNDDVIVALDEAAYEVLEDDGSGGSQSVMVCVEALNNEIQISVNIVLTIVAGTATLNEDYNRESNVALTLDESSSLDCVTVTTIPDNEIESDEMFIVSISSSDEHVVFDRDLATVTIQDNDFGLEQSEYTDTEGDISIEVCAIIESESALSIIQSGDPITIMTSEGTAEEGTDYTGVSNILTLDGGRQCLQVPLRNDDVVESEEMFTVVILGNIDPRLTASHSSANIVITDDDFAVISLAPPEGSTNIDREVNEDDSELSVCSVLTGEIDRSVTVLFVVMSGGARSGHDFIVEDNQLSHQLTFSSGQLIQCVGITILDDAITENLRETFTVALIQTDDQTMLGDDTGVITIIDNDRDCRFLICLNGGTCALTDDTNEEFCTCTPAFTGMFCQSSV